MGEGARVSLAQMGITVHAGVQGSADEAVRALLAGTLQATASATCDHHGHEHGHHDCNGHHGHDCGGHCPRLRGRHAQAEQMPARLRSAALHAL